MECLRVLCTDGAPAMLGWQQRFVTRFTKFVEEENNNNNLTSIHCIIHQEALCAKVNDFSDTLSQVRQNIYTFGEMPCDIGSVVLYLTTVKNLWKMLCTTLQYDGFLKARQRVVYWICDKKSRRSMQRRINSVLWIIPTFWLPGRFSLMSRPTPIAWISACRTGT